MDWPAFGPMRLGIVRNQAEVVHLRAKLARMPTGPVRIWLGRCHINLDLPVGLGVSGRLWRSFCGLSSATLTTPISAMATIMSTVMATVATRLQLRLHKGLRSCTSSTGYLIKAV